MRYTPVNPSNTYANLSEEHLKAMWKSWYPGGSGPTGEMRTICGLIESIAHLRGFDVAKWNDNDTK